MAAAAGFKGAGGAATGPLGPPAAGAAATAAPALPSRTAFNMSCTDGRATAGFADAGSAPAADVDAEVVGAEAAAGDDEVASGANGEAGVAPLARIAARMSFVEPGLTPGAAGFGASGFGMSEAGTAGTSATGAAAASAVGTGAGASAAAAAFWARIFAKISDVGGFFSSISIHFPRGMAADRQVPTLFAHP